MKLCDLLGDRHCTVRSWQVVHTAMPGSRTGLTEIVIDIIGWIGSVEGILAYMLISWNKVNGKSKMYQWLNLSGAVFLIANTVYYGAFPSAIINVVWVVVAISSLWKNAVQW